MGSGLAPEKPQQRTALLPYLAESLPSPAGVFSPSDAWVCVRRGNRLPRQV